MASPEKDVSPFLPAKPPEQNNLLPEEFKFKPLTLPAVPEQRPVSREAIPATREQTRPAVEPLPRELQRAVPQVAPIFNANEGIIKPVTPGIQKSGYENQFPPGYGPQPGVKGVTEYEVPYGSKILPTPANAEYTNLPVATPGSPGYKENPYANIPQGRSGVFPDKLNWIVDRTLSMGAIGYAGQSHIGNLNALLPEGALRPSIASMRAVPRAEWMAAGKAPLGKAMLGAWAGNTLLDLTVLSDRGTSWKTMAVDIATPILTNTVLKKFGMAKTIAISLGAHTLEKVLLEEKKP